MKADPRKGMPDTRLPEQEFKRRFLDQYIDPAFDSLRAELERVAGAAWEGYRESRKSPRTRKAGRRFSDPDYHLAADWLKASTAIETAQSQHDDFGGPDRFLVINGSPRNDYTCPGEMSKTFRLTEPAVRVLEASGNSVVAVLDLSRLAAENDRHIHPCKACFSTAAALCHWPCSCYPNYSLGQTQDWMNEIYPM